MYAAAIRIEIHVPDSHSLKEKRRIVRPLIEGLRRQASLSVSEVGHHESWQRAAVGVAIAAPDAGELERLIDRVRRYVDEQVELNVIDVRVAYLEAVDG